MPIIIDGTTGIQLTCCAGLTQVGAGTIDLQNPLAATEGGTGLTSVPAAGNALISDGANWTTKYIDFTGATVNCETKYCGISNLTPNLACANYYRLRLNTDTCICTLINESCCTSLYFDVIASPGPNCSGVYISFPNSFYPNEICHSYTEQRVYSYRKFNDCWFLDNVTCSSKGIEGDNSLYPVPVSSTSACGTFACCVNRQFIPSTISVNPTCACYRSCYASCGTIGAELCCALASLLPFYCCIPGDSKATTVIPNEPNTGVLGSRNLISSQYMPQVFGELAYIPTNYCKYPYGVYSFSASIGTGCRSQSLMVYNITETGIQIPNNTTADFNWYTCTEYCFNRGGPSIITHSVDCNYIAIYSRERLRTQTGTIGVYRLDCFLQTRTLCALQTITVPGCVWGTAACYRRENMFVKPGHNLDTCNTPAMLVAGCIAYNFWKGTSVCPLCYVCTLTHGLPAGVNSTGGCSLGNDGTYWCVERVSPDGQFVLMSIFCCLASTCNCLSLCMYRNCNYNSCTTAPSFTGIGSTCSITGDTSSLQGGNAVRNQAQVRADKDLCHVFFISDSCCGSFGAIQMGISKWANNQGYSTSIIGLATSWTTTSCAATTGAFFLPGRTSCTLEVIKCICVEKGCVYSQWMCSAANGNNNGLIFNSANNCWVVANTCYTPTVCNQFCYNIEFYSSNMRSANNGIQNPLFLHASCDSSVYTL